MHHLARPVILAFGIIISVFWFRTSRYQALNRVDPHRQWLLGVLVFTTAGMIVFLLISQVL